MTRLHASGKAAMNRPSPMNSQHSLASRQGLSRANMRGFKCAGAKVLRHPTPMSKPSSTVPASTTKYSKAMKLSGSQNSGASGGIPSAIASVSIMYRLSCAPAVSRHWHYPIAHVVPEQLQEANHAKGVHQQQGNPSSQ